MSMYQFHNQKPSMAKLRACIKNALAGHDPLIEIYWGENFILLEFIGGHWLGRGWIGKHGGDDIANELNRTHSGLN